ncbi:MAG: hypothetical protein GF411_19975 [Candidatus Lokiarchaeota archaeon]|nr:hypothetical protein [Candidatus Lokiarchaeota archaeon]
MNEKQLRQDALEALNRHRCGWIQLGKVLVEVVSTDQWKDWGYEKFTEYCKQELGLTIMTAKEMMMAYEYIQKNQPSLLNNLLDNPYVPDYHTLATLSRAVEKGKIDDDRETTIRDALFDADKRVESTREAKDMLSESMKEDGEAIMDDIKKMTKSVKKRMKKLNQDIWNTSSFHNEIQETSDKLTDMVTSVEV